MFFKTFCALKELKQNNINKKSFHVISMIGSTVACVQIYINLKKNCGKLNNEIASITSIVSFAVVSFIFFVYTPKFDLSLLSSNTFTTECFICWVCASLLKFVLHAVGAKFRQWCRYMWGIVLYIKKRTE